MHEDTYGCIVPAIIVVISIIFLCAISYVGNAVTEVTWNNGICAKCNTRYELKAAGTYDLRYYACPICYTEVKRF